MGRALQAEVTAAAKVPPGAQHRAGIVPIRLPVEALALVTPKFPARLLPRLLLSPGGTGGGCPLPGAQPDELSREPCEACAKEQPRLLGEPGEQPRCKGHVAPPVSLCSPELPPARWPIPIAGAAGSRSFPAAGLCEGRKRLPGACRDPGRAGRGGQAGEGTHRVLVPGGLCRMQHAPCRVCQALGSAWGWRWCWAGSQRCRGCSAVCWRGAAALAGHGTEVQRVTRVAEQRFGVLLGLSPPRVLG